MYFWPTTLHGQESKMGGIILLFSRLIFTESFLLLSYLGLYYSYHQCQDISLFYRKRVLRLLIPFMMMAKPFYLIPFIGGQDCYGVFLEKTGLYYFIYGNNGMRYISISLLLHVLFLILYKLHFVLIQS